jgi:hypothetical protein
VWVSKRDYLPDMFSAMKLIMKRLRAAPIAEHRDLAK